MWRLPQHNDDLFLGLSLGEVVIHPCVFPQLLFTLVPCSSWNLHPGLSALRCYYGMWFLNLWLRMLPGSLWLWRRECTLWQQVQRWLLDHCYKFAAAQHNCRCSYNNNSDLCACDRFISFCQNLGVLSQTLTWWLQLGVGNGRVGPGYGRPVY